MNKDDGNVYTHPAMGTTGNGGDRSGFLGRLTALEIQVARIDERMKSMATKSDIANLRIWLLTTVIGCLVVILGSLVWGVLRLAGVLANLAP